MKDLSTFPGQPVHILYCIYVRVLQSIIIVFLNRVLPYKQDFRPDPSCGV